MAGARCGRRAGLGLGLLLILPAAAMLAALPPKPARYVSDGAGILSDATEAKLNAELDAFERETSSQVLVATFPELPADYALEDFTNRTFDAWGVGQKGKNNGAVLFVFPRERQMRIEVGYGLEGAIPDATAAAIIANEIRPAFRAGDFDAGITRGVGAILAAARGEYQGTGRTNADAGDAEEDLPGSAICFMAGLLGFFLLMRWMRPTGTSYRRGRRRDAAWWIPTGGGSWGGSGSWSSGGGGGGSDGGGFFIGGGGSSGGGGASGGW